MEIVKHQEQVVLQVQTDLVVMQVKVDYQQQVEQAVQLVLMVLRVQQAKVQLQDLRVHRVHQALQV